MQNHIVSTVRVGALMAATLVVGCASGVTSADCGGADWSALGFQDGAAGARSKLFEERADDCAKGAVAPDVAAYERSRAQGLKAYCSAGGGFAAGKSGSKYQDVCPADGEAAFLASFEKGVQLSELRVAHEKAIDDYDGALADLDQNQYLLGVAEKRYAKPSISNEDREHERQEVEHRRREILRLEKALPQMLSGIESARAALDAYEAELAAAGLPLD